MWTDREIGKTVVVAGYSPNIHRFNKDFLASHPVIGINKFGHDYHCDYWIGMDTGKNWRKWFMDDPRYEDEPKFLRTLQCPKFMRKPNATSEAFVPPDAGIFFDQWPFEDSVPRKWNNRLRFGSSTAMAAISLAIILGAKEIVLAGVDFIGQERADGSQYNRPDFWCENKESINNLMRAFTQVVPIYKTHPDSWIECEYKEF